MVVIISELSKYLMIILFACYTYESFSVLTGKKTDEVKKRILNRQLCFLFLIHLDAYAVIFANTQNRKMITFFLLQVLLVSVIQLMYRVFYRKASLLVANHLCMLLVIGFIILTRLNEAKAWRQFQIAVISTVIMFLIPFLIHHMHFLDKLAYLYAGVGIVLLALVAVLGKTSYGAKLSFTFFGISLQPSEFIKILFVFFVAAMFYQSTEWKQVVLTSVIAALHVLILVVSKDLGNASIFFITYLIMVYVATRDRRYVLAGLFSGSLAAVAAYRLFAHVRVRVLAWKDPVAVIDDQGYQICQSLFAIGTGGWFGMGLYQGLPNKIPVADEDFIFSAISEEMGGLFAVCLILICASCYLMFLNIAMQIHDFFYKLIALGLGSVYGFQVFLTIGGVTKFIPSTGVTLPIISYGGSSLMSMFMLFAIIQGLYILREDEIRVQTAESRKRNRKEKKQQS